MATKCGNQFFLLWLEANNTRDIPKQIEKSSKKLESQQQIRFNIRNQDTNFGWTDGNAEIFNSSIQLVTPTARLLPLVLANLVRFSGLVDFGWLEYQSEKFCVRKITNEQNWLN